MTIAITGATGFIGGHLVNYFQTRGHEMRLLVREGSKPASHWTDTGSTEIRLIPANPTHRDLSYALEGTQALVHLAGLAAPPAADAERRLQEANVSLTASLTKAAEEVGVRTFLHLSSIRVVVGSTSPSRIDDQTPPDPVDPYGRSKLASETVVADFASKGRLSVSLRPPLVIGSNAKGNWLRLQKLAASRLPLPLASVEARRSFLTVTTLCEALAQIVEHDWSTSHSGAYCLADPDPLTIGEVVQLLRKGLGRTPATFSFPGLGMLRRAPVIGGVADRLFGPLQVDSGRFFSRFHFNPSTPLDAAITKIGAQMRISS